MQPPDLTAQPPRSPRVRLGGFVLLPRMLDKARALLAGKAGEYNYACPLDQQFLQFAGVEAEALKREVAAGRSDSAILDWITANAAHRRTDAEIATWSAHQANRAPADTDSRQFFQETHAQIAPHRTDLATWFDLLDVDDFVSFGGQP